MQYLEGKDKLTNFQMKLNNDKDGEKIGVDLAKIKALTKKFIGKIIITRKMENSGNQTFKHPALIYNKSTIITERIQI